MKSLEGIEVYKPAKNADAALKLGGMRADGKVAWDKRLLHESARRIIFHKCFSQHCDLSHKEIEYFDHKFYYEMPEAQDCLERCYNTKIDDFFGAEYAK